MYPAVCWALTGGQQDMLLWVMPLVNLGAVGCLAWLGSAFARRRGMSPWWGFTLPFCVGASLPGLRDLTDPLAMLGMFGMIHTWLTKGRWWLATAAAVVAVLAREQNVAVVAIAMGVALLRRRPDMVLACVLALGTWSVWVAYLRCQYGEWPF